MKSRKGRRIPAKRKNIYMQACILMLTHNRLRAVADCLDSVVPALRDNQLLYILDNGSSDGTEYFVKSYTAGHPNIELELSSENLGVLGGRERLFQRVKKDFSTKRKKPFAIAFLDSDVKLYDKDWLENAIKYLELYPHVWMVGMAGSWMAHDWSRFTPAYSNPVDSVAGFCQVWRYDKLCEIEFDHSFEKFWAEDSDMCFQAIAKGGEVHAINLGVLHSPSHSGYGQDTSLFMRNMARLKEKWMGKGVIRAER